MNFYNYIDKDEEYKDLYYDNVLYEILFLIFFIFKPINFNNSITVYSFLNIVNSRRFKYRHLNRKIVNINLINLLLSYLNVIRCIIILLLNVYFFKLLGILDLTVNYTNINDFFIYNYVFLCLCIYFLYNYTYILNFFFLNKTNKVIILKEYTSDLKNRDEWSLEYVNFYQISCVYSYLILPLFSILSNNFFSFLKKQMSNLFIIIISKYMILNINLMYKLYKKDWKQKKFNLKFNYNIIYVNSKKLPLFFKLIK